MRYEGNIFRPPSEARSLIVQVTIGCAHNECTFCSMFKDKDFRVRNIDDVIEDLNTARGTYAHIDKIFLADGDALCLSNEKLLKVLHHIEATFPECERVSAYGCPQDVNIKSDEELRILKKAGLGIIYIGAESGSDEILKEIKKGATRKEIIEAVRKIEKSGINASVTFISGLGGIKRWEEHAVESGTMISQMEPTFVGLLTLMLESAAPLTKEVKAGNFDILSAEEIVAETALMIKNINLKKECIFRSNHASNYVSLRGTLPQEKEEMLNILYRAMEDRNMLKDERFRML